MSKVYAVDVYNMYEEWRELERMVGGVRLEVVDTNIGNTMTILKYIIDFIFLKRLVK